MSTDCVSNVTACVHHLGAGKLIYLPPGVWATGRHRLALLDLPCVHLHSEGCLETDRDGKRQSTVPGTLWMLDGRCVVNFNKLSLDKHPGLWDPSDPGESVVADTAAPSLGTWPPQDTTSPEMPGSLHLLTSWPLFSRPVVSDSLRPHGLWPTRLLCPWVPPGKNTGVGCHFFLQGIFPTQGSNSSPGHFRQILYH